MRGVMDSNANFGPEIRVISLQSSDGVKAVFASPSSGKSVKTLVTTRAVIHWAVAEIWDDISLVRETFTKSNAPVPTQTFGGYIDGGKVAYCETDKLFLGYVGAGEKFDSKHWNKKAFEMLSVKAKVESPPHPPSDPVPLTASPHRKNPGQPPTTNAFNVAKAARSRPERAPVTKRRPT